MNICSDQKIPIEVISGLVTFIDPTALPSGVSPDCADVAFTSGVPGTVKTRPGLTNLQGIVGATYMATYTDNLGNDNNLYLDANGNLIREFPAGTFTTFLGLATPGAYAKSDTAFGSEFIAFSDGKFGLNIPRRFISQISGGATSDRVSQVGAGLAPIATDADISIDIVSVSQIGPFAIAPDPIGLSPGGTGNIPLGSDVKTGDVVTIAGAGDAGYDGTYTVIGTAPFGTFLVFYFPPPAGVFVSGGGTLSSAVATFELASPAQLLKGQSVIIAGVTEAGYNGTWMVRDVIDSTHFTAVVSASGLPASSGGTLEMVGHIDAGVHQLSVLFITRNGYFTAPAPPSMWTAAGNLGVSVSRIPLGPLNVIARLLIFTAAGGNDYFYSQSNQYLTTGGLSISSFLIPDNTTTSTTVDFSDLALLSSSPANLLFDRIELPEVAAMQLFSDRIFAIGARNRVQNFVNMSFDGGVLAIGGSPLGWMVDSVSGAGGSTGNSSIWGFDYRISASGGGILGMITQDAYQDYLGVAILSPNTRYSLRVYLDATGALSGNFIVDIFSPTLGVLATATVPLSSVTPGLDQEHIVEFDTDTPATIPADALLRVYANFSVSSLQQLIIDNLEPFPTSEPYQGSVVYASNAADPEAFQGETGFMLVNENDGRVMRTMFVIRDRFYLIKNRGGLYVTTDDSTDEPSGWEIDTISRRVGSESLNSAGSFIGNIGEDWVVLFTREGAYIFWSTEPTKISQEIQPTWEQINWNYAYKSWVAIDTANRRILFGVPMGEATSPNKILQMDYQMLGSAEDISSSPAVSPTYTGQLKSHARSRKWTIWNLAMTAGDQIESSDGQSHTRLAGTTALYLLDDTALTDDGADINAYYVTNFYPTDEQKQQELQSQGNRILCGMLTCSMEGSGDFEAEFFGPNFVASQVIPRSDAPAIPLFSPPDQDIETIVDFSAERMAIKFLAQNGTPPQFSFSRADLYMAQDPVATLMGVNEA